MHMCMYMRLDQGLQVVGAIHRSQLGNIRLHVYACTQVYSAGAHRSLERWATAGSVCARMARTRSLFSSSS